MIKTNATILRSNCQVSISHNFSIMFRSGGTTWLLVFIGLIFVAIITGADQESDPLYDYGNSGCWLFKRGVQNWKYFCIKIDRKKKLLNFENWCNGEVSKSALIWLSKSMFYDENHQNLSHFFFHWRILIQNWKDFCPKINISKGNYWILRIGVMGRCKKCFNLTFKVNFLFYIRIFLNFFFIEEY